MLQRTSNHTVVEAIDSLANMSSRGFYFLEEQPGGIIGENQIPFSELHALIVRRAGALRVAGIGKGERVAIVIADTREFIVTFLGAIYAGIVPVPIYPPTGVIQLDRYALTLGSILSKSRASAVVASASLESALRAVQAAHPARFTLLTPEHLAACDAMVEPALSGSDDVAFLQFTSGSTSSPKGVAVTHANISANTDAIRAAFELTTDDVPISWLPLFHDMGLIGFLLTALYATVSTRFMPTQMFLRRPGSWLRTISRHRGTISVAPNFAFALVTRRLKDEEIAKLDLSSWRIAGCGAEPIRAGDLERFAERLAPAGFRREALLPMYGLAEATLAVTIPTVGTGLRCRAVDTAKLRVDGIAAAGDPSRGAPIACCGSALSVNQIGIFNADDATSMRFLEDDRVGEIRVRGPNVTPGYWDDPTATRAAFAGGYLRTGDLGFLHDGELYVCGRIKELMIVNGRNYFPGDIERVALAFDGVRAAMAFQAGSAPGEAGGEKLVLAVEAAVAEKIDVTLLKRAISVEVGLGIDDVVLLAPGQLPKTSSGKLRRVEARGLYEAGRLRRQQRERRPVVIENTQLVERGEKCLIEQ